MKNIAIVLLAGDSTRFQCDTPKQLYLLNDKPLCYYSLKPFYDSKIIDEVVIVTKKEYFPIMISNCSMSKETHLVEGGRTRFDSVDNALEIIKDFAEPEDNIFIHDGARLNLKEEHIKSLKDALVMNNAATLAIPMEDTIGELKNNDFVAFPNRHRFMRIQTPQAFKFKTILKAHELGLNEATDDAQLVLKLGESIKYVMGSKYLNKITTIEDIDWLKFYLGSKNE